ncbi:hypothetical protein [Neolewinella persica]|uniref:hypothetical protein n=1 Tax=Neolewinella persica TaxID=70998 RepID=UPI00035E0395|nr:hypothetical protein [Neolewinella persica]
MKSIAFFLLTVCLFFTGFQLQAQETGSNKPVRLVVAGALELGGDEIAEVFFIDGGSQMVRAGQGGSLFVGAQFQLPSVDKFFVRTAVGYKYVTTAADNINIRLTRIPFHFTGHFRITDDVHVGGGIALHRNIKFKVDDSDEGLITPTASGPRFEAGWKGLALTYTLMNYQGNSGETYNAGSLGLSFTALLPK